MSTYTDTLWYDEATNSLVIIDQTLLPNEEKTVSITTKEQLYNAIKTLAVRGAPAIGVSAAIGVAVAASRLENRGDFVAEVGRICDYVNLSRPTAVNLSWALGQIKSVVSDAKTQSENVRAMLKKALELRDDDIRVCEAIGRNGNKYISDGACVMTHCNAGRLAAVRYGTALAPIYYAASHGKKVHVYADETRPLLQGARLTAYELAAAGIDVTLQCDSSAATLLSGGKISAVFVGCDRCAANGDFANKIGTYTLAVAAHEFGVPFYVCLPKSTIDMNTPDGRSIVIEQRDGAEISDMWYKKRMAPENISFFNPAFDVTPAKYVTAYITEDE